MYFDPQTLDRFLVRSLKRLNETDCRDAIQILKKRMADLRNPEYHLTIPLDDLPLSTKARNALYHMNLLTVREIIGAGWVKLERERGLGPGTIREINALMAKIDQLKEQIKGMAGSELHWLLALKEPVKKP